MAAAHALGGMGVVYAAGVDKRTIDNHNTQCPLARGAGVGLLFTLSECRTDDD
jgi:hypothetical protein